MVMDFPVWLLLLLLRWLPAQYLIKKNGTGTVPPLYACARECLYRARQLERNATRCACEPTKKVTAYAGGCLSFSTTTTTQHTHTKPVRQRPPCGQRAPKIMNARTHIPNAHHVRVRAFTHSHRRANERMRYSKYPSAFNATSKLEALPRALVWLMNLSVRVSEWGMYVYGSLGIVEHIL